MREVAKYQVVDVQSGRVVGEYAAKSVNRARSFADRKDREYGAVRYVVRPVWQD